MKMKTLRELLTSELQYDSNWLIVQRIEKPEFDLDKPAEFMQQAFYTNADEKTYAVASNMLWIDYASKQNDSLFNEMTEEEKEFYLDDFIEMCNANLEEALEASFEESKINAEVDYAKGYQYDADENAGSRLIVEEKSLEAFFTSEGQSELEMFLSGYTPTNLNACDLDLPNCDYDGNTVFVKL